MDNFAERMEAVSLEWPLSEKIGKDKATLRTSAKDSGSLPDKGLCVFGERRVVKGRETTARLIGLGYRTCTNSPSPRSQKRLGRCWNRLRRRKVALQQPRPASYYRGVRPVIKRPFAAWDVFTPAEAKLLGSRDLKKS